MGIEPSGSIENMKRYADLVFHGDIDQKKAFMLIVSAFVIELYKIPDKPSDHRGIKSMIKKLEGLHNGQKFI